MSLSAYLLANKLVEAYSNSRLSALKIEYINPFMHDPGLHASTHTHRPLGKDRCILDEDDNNILFIHE